MFWVKKKLLPQFYSFTKQINWWSEVWIILWCLLNKSKNPERTSSPINEIWKCGSPPYVLFTLIIFFTMMTYLFFDLNAYVYSCMSVFVYLCDFAKLWCDKNNWWLYMVLYYSQALRHIIKVLYIWREQVTSRRRPLRGSSKMFWQWPLKIKPFSLGCVS